MKMGTAVRRMAKWGCSGIPCPECPINHGSELCNEFLKTYFLSLPHKPKNSKKQKKAMCLVMNLMYEMCEE